MAGAITNKIINGDCLEIIPKHILSETVDLIYLDPPFFTQEDYGAFNDKWDSLEVYLAWMKPRIQQCFNVLKKTGSFYLHCDKHASHYLKVMCDEIFGIENFKNEIIWNYSGTGKPTKKLKEKHDNLLVYSKGSTYTFNVLTAMPTNPSTIKRYNKIDMDGKKYKEWVTRGVKRIVYMKPVPLDDVWDISVIGATAKERLGYDTQKPEALLERIIKASSNEGDLILDPFCGSGTTIAVAKRLNRKAIGIDSNKDACIMSRQRVKNTPFCLTLTHFLTPFL